MEVLRVLIIDKGFGGGITGEKYSQLKKDASLSLHLARVEEPLEEVDINNACYTIESLIKDIAPHVLIASSRGGKIAAHLVIRGVWKGPLLLISSMSTSMFITDSLTSPVLVLHGTRDGTNPIWRVRKECCSCLSARLVEFDDDHGLHKADALLPAFVREASEMSSVPALDDVPRPRHRHGEDNSAYILVEEGRGDELALKAALISMWCPDCRIVCEPTSKYKCNCGHYISKHSASPGESALSDALTDKHK